MSSIREIRERIDSVQSTLKITNAMYMISSTKLNKARAELAATEPYFYGLQAMFGRVIRHIPPDFHHPYLEFRHEEEGRAPRRAFICVTADKGLAGAYNHNVERMAEDLLSGKTTPMRAMNPEAVRNLNDATDQIKGNSGKEKPDARERAEEKSVDVSSGVVPEKVASDIEKAHPEDEVLQEAEKESAEKTAADEASGKDTLDRLYVIGEVGRHYFESRGIPIAGEFRYTAQNPTLGRARHIASLMLDAFRDGDVDEVFIIYTRMKNSMESTAECRQLLPLIHLDENLFQMAGSAQNEEFMMSPDPTTLLDNIIPDFVAGYIYSALVESYASEQSARMQAMDAANKAGEKLVQELKVQYNRERQGQITQEITEVAAGARARKQQLEKMRKRREKKAS